MGKRWRRFTERCRQQVVAPHFQPASTERNHLMFREASKYNTHFRAILRKVTRLMKDYEDLNGSVLKLLECRAPRLYNMESDGSVGPEVREEGDVVLGMGTQRNEISSSAETLQKRMTEEVLSLIQKWFKSFETCKVQLYSLDAMKYELDSRQRTVVSLDYRKHNMEEKVDKEDSKKTLELKQASAKFEHKEVKYLECLASFRKQEEELNQSFRILLSEVSTLTEHIGHAYEILSDVPKEVGTAFKPATFRPTVTQTPPVFVPPMIKPKAEAEQVKESPELGVNPTDKSNPFLASA